MKVSEDFAKRIYQKTKDGLPDAIETVMQGFAEGCSPYRYLIKAFPVKVDDEAAPIIRDYLKNAGSPALCNGDYVAIDTKNFAVMLTRQIIEDVENGVMSEDDAIHYVGDTGWGRRLVRDARTIISHEYTHLVYEHGKKRVKYMHKYSDQKAYLYAEEVQANRGLEIDYNSEIIKTGVTAKNLKNAGCEDIEKSFSFQALYDTISKWNRSRDKKQDDKSSDSQQNSDDGESEEDKSGTGNGTGTGDIESDKNKENNSKSGNENGSEQKPKSGFENALEQVEKKAQYEQNFPPVDLEAKLGIPKQDNKLDNKSSENQQENELLSIDKDAERGSDENVSNGGTSGMGATELADPNPKILLDMLNERIEAQNIEKAMRSLKAVMKGDLSRGKTKTYSRPPRRCNEGNLFKKGIKKNKATSPTVLVALDKSGSMDSARVTGIAKTIDAIVKQIGRNTKGCYICLHDGLVHEVSPLRDWKNVVEKYYAQGGNNFQMVYEEAKRLGVDAVLNVGDGLDNIVEARNGKKISDTSNGPKWYDVIVTQLGNYSRTYWCLNVVDKKLGVERTPIDVCNGLNPIESVAKDDLDYALERVDGWV